MLILETTSWARMPQLIMTSRRTEPLISQHEPYAFRIIRNLRDLYSVFHNSINSHQIDCKMPGSTGNPLLHPFLFLFQLFQWCVAKVLAPEPPNPSTRLGRPKIAVIGAGITGVTSAAHCIGHGFDVVIFEAGDRESLGGIWSVCQSLLPRISLTACRKSTIPRACKSIP